MISLSRDFQPAYALANRLGCKALVYGPPGSGKTPISSSAPRPVLCAIEPGLLSMRNSNIPVFEAYTVAKINDFFAWVKGSSEAKGVDTICIDSVSQMGEVYLRENPKKVAHGLKLYGDMSEWAMIHLNDLYYLSYKHTYLICKEGKLDTQQGTKRIPYFPGKDLNIKVPHLFDFILHCSLANVPHVGTVKAFRCNEAMDVLARDRSGKLAEFEPCDLAALFNKAMS